MAYVTREYLATQFTNFATRIATVFAKKTEIPAKTSELTNNSGFITNDTNSLTNYYKKEQTYNKSEVDTLIANISTMSFEKVDILPTENISTTTIYLVPKTESSANNVFVEYVYINGSWEIIGETDANLDGYVTDNELATTLSGYLKKTDTETSNIDFSAFFS